MNAIKWASGYIKKDKLTLIWATILLVGNATLVFYMPLLTGRLVDVVITNRQMQWLSPILGAMIAITLFRTATRYWYQILFEKLGQNAIFRMRNEMYQKLQRLDFSYLNHTRTGDEMARMTGDIEAVRHFISWITYNFVESLIWFVVAVASMALIQFQLMLALVAVTPIIYWLNRQMVKKTKPIFLDTRNSFANLNAMVEENISGNRVVKAFAREAYEIEKFNRHNLDFKEKNLQAAKLSSHYLPLLDGLANTLTIISLVFGGLLVIYGKMSIGDLVMFNSFLWMINQPIRMSGWLMNDTQRFITAYTKIQQLLSEPERIPETEKEPTQIQGEITFKHVSFAYPDAPENLILEDISLEIPAGSKVGILGATGSGKSTLVHLITRFYDVTEGVILIDQQPLKDYRLKDLRQQISIVMQDDFLFSDTISGNLSFGAPEADALYIKRMAGVADATNFIESLPEGYDTIVGERGVGLSGGQRQRISLARGLIKDPAILILDDTTSAVDMETETKIQAELTSLNHQLTTLVIAHRISSIKDADQIIVLENGKIIQKGTHDTLVQEDGYYAIVYQSQLGLNEGGL